MKRIHIYISLLLLAGICQIKSQDFKQDMTAMNKRTFKAKNLGYTLLYRMYLDNNFAKPYQEREVKTLRSQPYNLLLKDDNQSEIIINKTSQLVVSHKHKHIILKPLNVKESKEKEILDLFTVNFDSLMVAYKKIISTKITDELINYECIMVGGVYTKINILYDSKNHLPVKVTYYYKFPIRKNAEDDKQHPCVVEVLYKDFNFQPGTNPETFSQNKYIHKKGDKYLVAKAYSSYKFINLFDNNYEPED